MLVGTRVCPLLKNCDVDYFHLSDKAAHATFDACRTIGREHVEMLLESILEVARELPSCSAAPGGEAGPQAARETARAAAGRANDAPPKESTPQGASNDHLPCIGTELFHRSCSSAAKNARLEAFSICERHHSACNLCNYPYVLRPGGLPSKKACSKYGWVMVADSTASQDSTQGDKSKAQRKTRKAAVSAENAMPTAPPASRSPPVPPDRLLEHMLTLELGEAKMRDDGYRSGIAARMYGESREATVAARVVEMSVRELEVELDTRLTEEYMKYGCGYDVYEAFMGASMRRVRAQVAASVKPEHRRLDRPVVHDLHAAALMLLAQLEADSSAAGDSRPEKLPSETRKAPANCPPQTSGIAPKEQAASQLPTTTSAAGAGKCTEVAVGSQEPSLTSDGQVAGSHSSPGRVLSLSTSAYASL